METFGAIETVLEFAIMREQEAVDFYGTLAEQATNPAMVKTFLSFAKVEQGHKVKLLAAKNNPAVLSNSEEVVDLKTSDYLVEVEPSTDMSMQDALLVAMKREKAAMELYSDMEKRVNDEDLQALFKKLAHEERTHKHKFEAMYDEHFIADN